MSQFGPAVKAFAIFIIIELLLILLILIILGAFGLELQLINDMVERAGTTRMDLAIGIGILGTLANFIMMFIITIFTR